MRADEILFACTGSRDRSLARAENNWCDLEKLNKRSLLFFFNEAIVRRTNCCEPFTAQITRTRFVFHDLHAHNITHRSLVCRNAGRLSHFSAFVIAPLLPHFYFRSFVLPLLGFLQSMSILRAWKTLRHTHALKIKNFCFAHKPLFAPHQLRPQPHLFWPIGFVSYSIILFVNSF